MDIPGGPKISSLTIVVLFGYNRSAFYLGLRQSLCTEVNTVNTHTDSD